MGVREAQPLFIRLAIAIMTIMEALGIRIIERMAQLHSLDASQLSPDINLFRAQYQREIPPHYQGNALTRSMIDVNIILVSQGMLFTPRSTISSFQGFFYTLRKANPALFQRILSPSGTAKVASGNLTTPIKEIAAMNLAGQTLPGDAQMYGWEALEQEARQTGLRLQLLFQGNGLYFNRGSVLFDGENVLAYPDMFLADWLKMDGDAHAAQRIAVSEPSLKRPLLFFLTNADSGMEAFVHEFLPDETYGQGMARLQDIFRRRGVRSALAASPPLVIPDREGSPLYLTLSEVLGRYHANDVRHSLYCPYECAVLLSPELGRAQCLQPEHLARAVSENDNASVTVQLAETLNYFNRADLKNVLNRKGYAGRFAFKTFAGSDFLSIRPLEGVYSHLVPFLTRGGVFGLLQTSGTRGNITGNDGPTLLQLSAILQDLNCQPPFEYDPIIAAASGSQGNDVPNLVCRSRTGKPGLLVELTPVAALDEKMSLRGVVTTPRVGIATLGA